MDDIFSSSKPLIKEVVSLQNLVLKVIALNFARYLREYYSSSSCIPKYFFKFLQKQYSQKLLVNLIEHGLLQEEFIDFVFNDNLKEVCLNSRLKQKKLECIRQKLNSIGESLSSLSMMGEVNFRNLRPALSSLPCLRKLELEYCNCDDSTLKVIASSCPLLTHLNLYASLVSDEGMKYLCFPEKHKLNLETLNVSRTLVKGAGLLMVLKNIVSLKILTHENLSKVVSDALANHDFPADQVLNLVYVEVLHPKTELQPISRVCPHIKHLFVKGMDSPQQLLHCWKFGNLRKVCLSYEGGPDLCIDEFLKHCGSQIGSLSLEGFALSSRVLSRSCPNLEVLKLYDPLFSEPSDCFRGPRSKFQKLTHFKVFGCSLLSSEEVRSPAFILESSPNLKSFSLQCCFIGCCMENAVLNCAGSLVQLDFTQSLVSINFLQEVVFKYRTLQRLIVENSGLQYNDYHHLLDVIKNLNHPVTVIWC